MHYNVSSTRYQNALSTVVDSHVDTPDASRVLCTALLWHSPCRRGRLGAGRVNVDRRRTPARCFALTGKKLAGVQSGLIVQTKAEYDAASETSARPTSPRRARTRTDPQGFVADKAVVLADPDRR